MAAASYEVCAPWAASDIAVGCCKGGFTDPGLATDAFLIASTMLYNLSGRRWPGVCADLVRPTAEHAQALGGWTPGDYWRANPDPLPNWAAPYGMWGFCGCDRTEVCGGASVSEILLPGYPVVAVTEVKRDGVVVPSSLYQLQDRRRLVALGDAWPCCQDVTKADTQTGTWSVAYTWGAAPPRGGVRAAAALGCELYKGWAKPAGDVCQLPERVTTITRQGVTMATLDPWDLFDKGRTGIATVDLWLASLDRGSRSRPSELFVPGQLPSIRRV